MKLTPGDRKEDGFRRICRGELKGVFDGNYTQPSVPRCHLLHHNNPYLGKPQIANQYHFNQYFVTVALQDQYGPT